MVCLEFSFCIIYLFNTVSWSLLLKSYSETLKFYLQLLLNTTLLLQRSLCMNLSGDVLAPYQFFPLYSKLRRALATRRSSTLFVLSVNKPKPKSLQLGALLWLFRDFTLLLTILTVTCIFQVCDIAGARLADCLAYYCCKKPTQLTMVCINNIVTFDDIFIFAFFLFYQLQEACRRIVGHHAICYLEDTSRLLCECIVVALHSLPWLCNITTKQISLQSLSPHRSFICR